LRRGFVPDQFDLSASMPEPAQQDPYGTCVAWATVYGAASYYARQKLKDPDLALSPAYVFNRVHHESDGKKCGNANMLEVLDFLARRGTPKFEEYPDELFCSQDKEASKPLPPAFQIAGYENVVNAGYDEKGVRHVERPLDLDVMRQTLAGGDPIVFIMGVNAEKLSGLGAGDIYSFRRTPGVKQDLPNHAMVLVGYDNQKQAFRLLNSWGPGWSDKGYGWIGYDSAKSEILEAFVLKADSSSTSKPDSDKQDVSHSDGRDCSDFDVSPSARGFRLNGYVENEAARERVVENLPAIGKKLGVHLDLGQIDIRPWPQCEALMTLKKPLASDDRPRLRTLDGRTDIRIGSRFAFELTSPGYPSFLYLIYLQADGQAVNLLPKKGSVREQVAPNTVLRVGDPSVQGPKFKASEPPGKEAVIAIASRSPIAQLEDLEQSGGAYFKVGFDNEDGQGQNAEDRRVLSALEDGLETQPVLPGAPRQIGADIVFMNIER
jgi:hypothetical protein